MFKYNYWCSINRIHFRWECFNFFRNSGKCFRKWLTLQWRRYISQNFRIERYFCYFIWNYISMHSSIFHDILDRHPPWFNMLYSHDYYTSIYYNTTFISKYFLAQTLLLLNVENVVLLLKAKKHNQLLNCLVICHSVYLNIPKSCFFNKRI